MKKPAFSRSRFRQRQAEGIARAEAFLERRRQHWREEAAAALTHGAGLLLFAGAVPVLITLALIHGSALHITAFSLYGGSLVLLYATSTLYHAARHPRLKRTFRVLDHAAIFILIAGTYTPIALLTLDGWLRGVMLVAVWSLAITGCVFKFFCTGRYERLSLALYLGMGWLALVVVKPVMEALPLAAFAWLVVGGLLYTGGVLFYAWQRLPYNHAVWHLFVLAASICHFVAIAWYAW